MGKPAVLAITVTGDTKDASKAIAAVDDDLAGLGKSADRASTHMDDVGKASGGMGDHFDETATKTATVAGGLGDLGGALSALPGPIGALGSGMELLTPAIMGVSGASDLAAVASEKLHLSTLKSTVSTVAKKVADIAAAAAAKAMAAAQWLVNAAMSANPILLVVLALVALTAAFIIAWKKSETFRTIVKGVFGAVLTAGKAVGRWFTQTLPKAFQAVLTFIRKWGPLVLAALVPFVGLPLLIWQHWSKVKGFIARAMTGVGSAIVAPFAAAWDWLKQHVIAPMSRMFDGILAGIRRAMAGVESAVTAPFKAAWNWIRDNVIGPLKSVWNTIAGAINAVHFSIKVPSFIPGIGGKGFTFDPPDVPTLAAGAVLSRATLAVVGEGPGREIVTPEALLRRILHEEGQRGDTVIINVTGALDPDAVARQIDRIMTARARRVGGVQRRGVVTA